MAPEGATQESRKTLDRVLESMQRTGVKLLWGIANLFSNRRFLAGAATNPDPEVFAYAGARVVEVLEATHRLGGENFVLWRGCETLLNTNMKPESDPFGRFLWWRARAQDRFQGPVAHRAEGEGTDQAPVRLRHRDGARVPAEVRAREGVQVNIEANHVILAGHSFQHESRTRSTTTSSAASI